MIETAVRSLPFVKMSAVNNITGMVTKMVGAKNIQLVKLWLVILVISTWFSRNFVAYRCNILCVLSIKDRQSDGQGEPKFSKSYYFMITYLLSWKFRIRDFYFGCLFFLLNLFFKWYWIKRDCEVVYLVEEDFNID